MKYLLDTHTLLWVALDSDRLSLPVRAILAEARNNIFVSAASAWEIATKHRLGKLPGVELFLEQFETRSQAAAFHLLGLSVPHALLAGSFPTSHKDPFDRMLAAQALVDGLVLLSKDPALDAFGVRRVW